MQEMKDMILQQNEAVVRRQIARADIETAEIEGSMQQLTVSRSNELSRRSQQSKESEQSKQELLRELVRQQGANKVFKELCEEALSQTIYEHPGQKINGVRATNYGSALTGFINMSGEETRIDQDISDVSADNWGIAVAGVIKNVDFKDLREGRPRLGDHDVMRREL